MFKLLAVAALVAAAAAAPQVHKTLKEAADYVNSVNAGWVAEEPVDRFGSLEDVAKVCGTWTVGHPKYNATRLPVGAADINPAAPAAIPTEFDSKVHWANCSVMKKVRDQSACGSCWAFGSTESFEERRCAAGLGDVEFSTEDTAGCCKGFLCGMSQGCNGGQPSAALKWMTSEGVVTGGDYFDIGSGTTCEPYLFKPCAHHVPPSSKYPACPSEEYSVKCSKDCSEAKYTKSYEADKTKGKRAFSLNTVEGMQTSIMQEGPLAVAFTVYADFPTYKSGVYKHTSGQALGGHAVEMVGWGVENGQAYWLIKNSWNDQWGAAGYFKIARGTNECGIESDVSGISF